MNLTNIQLGSNTAPGSPFTVNRYIDANSFKLVINGTGTNIFELTTGVSGATRRFAFGSSGQYTMDAYGSGTFTGTETKWLAVTAAGLVIEKNPPTSTTITANNALTMSTSTNVQLGAVSALTTDQPLLHDTYINANTFKLIIGTATSEVLEVLSNTAGNVVKIQNSGNGNGLFSLTGGGLALIGQSNYSSTNAIEVVARLNRVSSGGAGANGLGGKLEFNLETSTSALQNAASIASSWGDATNSTRSGSLRNFVVGLTNSEERLSIFGNYTTLTESSATVFLRVNIPSATVSGGEIIITVEANDATNYQSRTLRFIWSAVNKSGTITATVQTPEEAFAESAGGSTLSVTIDTNDAGSGNLDFRANAVSSLTQTTLRCCYQIIKNIGTGTITPQ